MGVLKIHIRMYTALKMERKRHLELWTAMCCLAEKQVSGLGDGLPYTFVYSANYFASGLLPDEAVMFATDGSIELIRMWILQLIT